MTTVLLWMIIGGAAGAAVGGVVDFLKWREKRVVPSTDKFNAAMRQLRRDFEQMAEQIGRAVIPAMVGLARALGPVVRTRHMQMARYGPRNFTGDGAWQSDLCAAWVHDSCPLSASCDCRCHHG